jgi:hypothetical protein
MPQLERIGSWTRVPGGSSIRVSVTGTTATDLVTAHLFLLREDGVEQTFPDSAVQPGPVSILLDSPHTYSLLLDLNFVTAAKAEVTAEVISPFATLVPQDGAPPPVFNTSIQGTQSVISGVTFFVTTA